MLGRNVFIIAEAGVNHNGDIRLARRLIDAAAAAGADAVKFQTFKSEKGISRHTPKAAYQKKTTNAKESMLDMVRKLELSEADHRVLKDHCRKSGIKFMSTPFDEDSVDLLHRLGVGIFKIPSGEITNLALLVKIAKQGKPIILSTGMSSLSEVRWAVKVLVKQGAKQIALLHCVSQYPAPYDQMNLKAMGTLAKHFKLPVGLSDHSLGIWMPIAATALGAKIIEKHLTLDNDLPGPDHKASLEPKAFKEMVQAIRAVELALGDGIKKLAVCEEGNVRLARKFLVAARDLPAGHVLTGKDMEAKRVGHGLAPALLTSLIGKKTIKAIGMDMPVTRELLK